MAEMADLERALIAADAAGDAESATVLANEIQRVRTAMGQNRDLYSTNPTEGMSGSQKFLAGAGKAMTDIGRGFMQTVMLGDQDAIDASKKRDEPLMQTGAGFSGSVVGNIAAGAPVAMIPGAGTIGGAAAGGALLGILQPTATNESWLENTAVGGAAGAVVPAIVAGTKAAKAGLVDPFTEAGRSRIAANLLRRTAANPDDAAARLATAAGATPGFTPTVGQASDDAGLASLERTMRAIDPRGFDEIDKSQRGALVEALRKIAQTPEARAKAASEADSAVRPLYDAAKKAVVPGDDEITALLTRPSMDAARARAGNIAAERGQQFVMQGGTPATSSATGILDEFGAPIMRDTPAVPGRYQGQALHDLKMGLDDAIGNPGLGGMQGAERNAALGTKEQFLAWLESKIPEYGQAKNLYAEKMRPVNQMDIGQELYNRFVPALADQGGLPFRNTASSYANALRNGDDLARNVTGMKGVTLDKIMSPEQMQALQGVAKDSAMKAAGETAGRGVGSDTVQKISMSNIAAEAGVPNWLSKAAAVPGGWAKRAGDVLYGSADEQIRMRTAELLRDPQAAAAAMRQAGVPPAQIAEWLRLAGQSSSMALPATVEASE